MITKQMRDFMKKHGVNKLYNWMDEDYNSEAIPKLPKDENVKFVDWIQGIGDNAKYHLNDGTVCTKKEFEASRFFIDDEEILKELMSSEIRREDFEDEDEYLEEIHYSKYEYLEDAQISGSILQERYVSTEDQIEECPPGHCKVVLREFKIERGVDLNQPILIFSNDAGDYGSPEIDNIMVDDNCYVKRSGDLDFNLYVFLKEIPEDNKINILVQMSTCLDS